MTADPILALLRVIQIAHTRRAMMANRYRPPDPPVPDYGNEDSLRMGRGQRVEGRG